MTELAEPENLFVDLDIGDPAPWFHQRSTSNENYAFSTAGGHYVVLAFYGSAGDDLGRAAVHAVASHREVFDDERVCFFGVSTDAADEAEGRVAESMPGIRFFWDFDVTVSRAFGAVTKNRIPNPQHSQRRFWLVLDARLRVIGRFTLDDHEALFGYLAQLPPVGKVGDVDLQAPVLFLPNVFSPQLCGSLRAAYDQHGGKERGFMRDIDGKTVEVLDSSHKVRKDHLLQDPELVGLVKGAIGRRVIPEIQKVFYFNASRMERYLVGCYTAEDGGHFRAHRDNTTAATAHRRFAVSINLNSDFEGGELSFPEYGPRGFKPPLGGAVVFSCSLLHAVSPVTAGRRFAFLPFLYDDAAAKIREQNAAKLQSGSNYKA